MRVVSCVGADEDILGLFFNYHEGHLFDVTYSLECPAWNMLQITCPLDDRRAPHRSCLFSPNPAAMKTTNEWSLAGQAWLCLLTKNN